ncbi:MAG: CamS family sex pheromone protein [Clostridium baratii]
MTVNIDFYGLVEKLSFHQLLAQLMNETFSNYYDITVVVRSTEEIFGILTRNANEKI